MAEMWHFIADNKLRDGSEPAPVGGVERWDGPVVLCRSGLHACPRALDALKYAPSGAPSGTIQVRLVLLSGIVLADDDKAAASERHILASADCTRELHEFALWCAESVRYLMVDSRSTTALTVKRSWLDGQATDDELSAAWAAAWAAGWGAARRGASPPSEPSPRLLPAPPSPAGLFFLRACIHAPPRVHLARAFRAFTSASPSAQLPARASLSALGRA